MQTRPILESSVPWQPVGRIGDLEFLVKESEVLTGQAGRTFVISGADWLVYRVSFCERTHPSGLKVERLDAHGRVVSTQHLQVWEFLDHSLVEAQAAGQLFTPPVRRHG